MRRGMNSLVSQVQQVLNLTAHGGDLFVFRGKRASAEGAGGADGLGMSLYIKRAWSAAASSGRRRSAGWCRSAAPNWRTCSTASTGACPGTRRPQAAG